MITKKGGKKKKMASLTPLGDMKTEEEQSDAGVRPKAAEREKVTLEEGQEERDRWRDGTAE